MNGAPETRDGNRVERPSGRSVRARPDALFGADDLLVTLDATFAESSKRDEVDAAIDRIERGIVAEFPQARRIFVESENIRATRAAAARIEAARSAGR